MAQQEVSGEVSTTAKVWDGSADLKRLVPINDLEAWPGNPRLGDISAIAASLTRFGQVRPVLIDGKRIIGGHHVVEAARLNGWTHIAVTENTFADEEEARAYLLADNNLGRLGGFDDELLLAQLEALTSLDATGYDDTYLTQLRAEVDAQARAQTAEALGSRLDEVPELPAEPTSVFGEVYELGEHRVMCGDATKPEHVAKLLDGDEVACIVTSPPYAIGMTYDGYEDTLDNLRLLLAALATLWREHVAAGGFAVVNFEDLLATQKLGLDGDYPMSLLHYPLFTTAGWFLDARRIWAKPHAMISTPWTAASNRAATDWEHLWTWRRDEVKRINERRDPSFYGVWDTRDAFDGNRLVVGKETHGASFPTVIPRQALAIYSNPGDVVADPFAGTGTTLIAADLLGRRARLLELSPRYVDVIRERFANYQQAKENLGWSGRLRASDAAPTVT